MTLQNWESPPEYVELGEDEVHVWIASTEDEPHRAESLYDVLGSDEQERAEKFFYVRDRDRFIVAHAVLRMILSRYCNVPAKLLAFSRTRHGKPALMEPAAQRSLHFNLSHSGALMLIAVTRSHEIGVDIERSREDIDIDEIAAKFFSAQEVAMLHAVPTHQRIEAFFNCWTRKEAYVKGRGEGLSHPLGQFVVSLTPGEPAALLHSDANLQMAKGWSLFDLPVGPDYFAALAVSGDCPLIRYWQWSN